MNPVDPKDQDGAGLPNPLVPQSSSSAGFPTPAGVSNGSPQMSMPSGGHPIVPTPVAPMQTSPMPVLNDLNPAAAEDSDLIEQEWVDKAKAIVEHTRNDPHKQNEEVNKMKADYIKKRYGKDIKMPNE